MKRWIHANDDIETGDIAEDYIYRGKKYRVSSGYSNTKWTNNPEQAIKYWYMFQKKDPMDCSIMTRTKEDALALVKAGSASFLTALDEKFGCPYKLDYMIDECAKKVADGCKWFHDSQYGDTVHPFGVG